MQLLVFKNALRKFESRIRTWSTHRLHSCQAIDHFLEVERARADRNGSEFSVVVFGPVSQNNTAPSPKLVQAKLARVMIQRSRSTDHVGHFPDGRFCAVLPDTCAQGAKIFATDVCQLLTRSESEASAPFKIYAYPPSDFPGGGDEPHGHDEPRPAPRRRGSGRRPAHHAPRTELRGVLTERAIESGSGGGVATLAARTQVRAVAAVAPREVFPEQSDYPSTTLAVDVRPLTELLMQPLPIWKRAIDIAGASFGLIVAAPVMVAVAILIKLTSDGPIVFRQHRCGLGGKSFEIFKFRTMCVDAERKKSELMALNEQDGPAFKLTNDPRVTRIGGFLRKTSLDELPQLFNVLRGEMSLVGPRPLPVKEQLAADRWHHRRLDVTPGLTCIWQVTGRSTVSFDRWVRMDVMYIQTRSFLHDLKILFLTVPAVMMRKGAR